MRRATRELVRGVHPLAVDHLNQAHRRHTVAQTRPGCICCLMRSGLRRWLIFVPVLTPYLSGLWLALVTPASFEVGRHLIEGLQNPTVVLDKSALEEFPIRPMGVKEAMQEAIANINE